MIGNVVGNYKIIEKVGEGGMGAVFKGVDVMLDREVAIKSLRPELASHADLLARFRSEAVTLAKLNHPNIATLFSFFRSGDDFYMVLEFVDGPTLDDMIRDQKVMPVDKAVPLFCQALEGIDHAHNMGILHRDIKPANIMVSTQGVVKVTDFGIARVLGEAGMTRQGAVVGTIEYMSPERIQGKEVDQRSDIYALGVVLYEMLTGRGLFSTTSEYELMRAQVEQPPPPPREFAPHIPEAVEAVIMRSLAKKPEYRIPTAAEFRDALREAAKAKPVSAAQTVPATRSGVAAPPPAPKETVLYEEPRSKAAVPPPLPETRFVEQVAPRPAPPGARVPVSEERELALAPPARPPESQQAPAIRPAVVKDVVPVAPPLRPPTPSSLDETMIAPHFDVPRRPAGEKITASKKEPRPKPAAREEPAATAVPTLGSIEGTADGPGWKRYVALAAGLALVAVLLWGLMSGGEEASPPAIGLDPSIVEEPSPAPAAPDLPAAAEVERPLPPEPPRPDRRVAKTASPPKVVAKRPPSVPPVAPKIVPAIEQSEPLEGLSQEEVAAAAALARERLREKALKALEK